MSARIFPFPGVVLPPVAPMITPIDLAGVREVTKKDPLSLSKYLDQRRDMNAETIRLRLERVQRETGGISIEDILRIARESFATGASAHADGLFTLMHEQSLEEMDALEEAEAMEKARLDRLDRLDRLKEDRSMVTLESVELSPEALN